jgi:hypothetical protein
MTFDPDKFIRNGGCRVVWIGILGHEDGEKELSADEGPAELKKILDWPKAVGLSGQILFFYPDLEDPNKIHEKLLTPSV